MFNTAILMPNYFLSHPVKIQPIKSPLNKIEIVVKKIFIGISALFDPLITFFGTQPLSDALGLKTYTHGTNFNNYLNIRC